MFRPHWSAQPEVRFRRGPWLLWLLLLIVALALPSIARHLSYSIALGRMQAEAQVARDYLAAGQQISIADYPWVVKVVEPSVVGVRANRIIEGQPSDELSALFGPRQNTAPEIKAPA